MTTKPRALCLGLVFLSAGGCGHAPSAGGEEVASVSIAIQNVPSDIRCIQIEAKGSRMLTRRFDVTPGAATTLTMPGVAPGSTTFSGASFPFGCSGIGAESVPTWVADATTVNVASAAVTNLVLTMRPAGNAGIVVDFLGGADGGVPLGVWDSTNWENAVFQ